MHSAIFLMSKHKIHTATKVTNKIYQEFQVKAFYPLGSDAREQKTLYLPHKKTERSQGGTVDGSGEEASFAVLIHMFLLDMAAITVSYGRYIPAPLMGNPVTFSFVTWKHLLS